jgi:predicted DNA-binding transcriptional regulator YafY
LNFEFEIDPVCDYFELNIFGGRMFDFQSRFKRQIEILGLCMSGEDSSSFKTFDLAALFNVEELTIKRDLLALRSYGIDIHSHKKRGVTIDTPLSNEKISDLILHYCSLSQNHYTMDRSTNLLVEKLGESALANIVLLQRCIDNMETAAVDYNKLGEQVEKEKPVEPLFIFQSEGSWRVVVNSDGHIKQLLIDKIISVKPTGKRFMKGDYNINDLVKYSWKSWFGNEKHCIKLWMSAFWAEIITPRMLAGDQVISKNDDGSIIFQCTVNSLNEISGWIVSRGEGIKVIEPEELKIKVLELAEGVLKNYNVSETALKD